MSQKYVIYYKKTLSAKSQFINKHIYLINKGFNTSKITPFNTLLTQKPIYKELLCMTLRSLAFLCIESQCITLLCITAQCIALQGITDPHKKRPELFCECPNKTPHRFYRFFRVYLCILSWSFLCFV